MSKIICSENSNNGYEIGLGYTIWIKNAHRLDWKKFQTKCPNNSIFRRLKIVYIPALPPRCHTSCIRNHLIFYFVLESWHDCQAEISHIHWFSNIIVINKIDKAREHLNIQCAERLSFTTMNFVSMRMHQLSFRLVEDFRYFNGLSNDKF